MMLESYCHDESIFVTLTYNDEHLPKNRSLDPDHTKKWMYRFRKAIKPVRIRFFLVGEYGDQTWRPHYHAILFGAGYWAAPIIQETWGMGFTKVGDFNEKTAQYTCGYVTKKMTKADDPRLKGRYPEYSRQSRMPGLGAGAMETISEVLSSDPGVHGFADNHDVPYELKMGKRSVPLGRYLRSKLQAAVGMPDHVRDAIREQFMAESSLVNNEMLRRRIAADPGGAHTSSSVLLEENRGKIINAEGRARNFKQKRSL